jgi:hypothetical protein
LGRKFLGGGRGRGGCWWGRVAVFASSARTFSSRGGCSSCVFVAGLPGWWRCWWLVA